VAQTPSFSREVSGSIVDLDGKPLANVRVTAAGFHAAQTQPETTTDASGAFHLTGLLDANAYLRFEADGFYSEIAAVYLEGSADTVELEPLGLVAKQPNHSTYRFHLAMAYSNKGDKTRALEQLRESLKYNPAKEEKDKILQLITRLG